MGADARRVAQRYGELRTASSSMDELAAIYESREWREVERLGNEYNRNVRELAAALKAWMKAHRDVLYAQTWGRDMLKLIDHEVFWG